MLENNDRPLPRDPQALLRDFSVSIQLKDIKRLQKLHERLAPRWWEHGFLALLFLSTASFLVTLITVRFSGVEQARPALDYILYVSFGLMMISLIAVLEFLLAKVTALRLLYQLLTRELAAAQEQLKAQQKDGEDSSQVK